VELTEPAQARVIEPPILRWGPLRTFVLTKTRLYPFLTPFLPPLFNSKSIEVLTKPGEVQCKPTTFNGGTVIWKVGEQGISILTATLLKVHLCGPLHLHGTLALPCCPFTPTQGLLLPLGALSPQWAPYTYTGPFTTTWGPFTPVSPPPVGGTAGVVGTGSGN